MTTGREHKQTEEYVNKVIGAFLSTNKDVEGIECRHTANGDCYIKLLDAFGTAHFYDATNMDMGEICQMVCRLMSGIKTHRQIADFEAIREVNKLFA